MHRRVFVSILCLVLIAAAACSRSVAKSASPPAVVSSTTQPGSRIQGVPAFGNVFLIVGENTSLSKLTPASAPYLNGQVKGTGAWVTNYYSLPADGSLAQYVGMTSGQYIKCDVANLMPWHCNQNVDNLFHQLDSKNISWKEWMESATNACDFYDSGMGWSFNIYGAHHNPAIYYDNIEGGHYSEGKTPSSECLQNVLATGSTAPNDTSALDAALASGRVGRFNLIVPNDCEQGHDPCGTNNPAGQYDSFLAREIPKIEASPAFGSNGLILVTYDEGSDPPVKNHFNILLAALGPMVKAGTYSGAYRYDHYSLLRTIEDGFGVPALAGAKAARPISGIWK